MNNYQMNVKGQVRVRVRKNTYSVAILNADKKRWEIIPPAYYGAPTFQNHEEGIRDFLYNHAPKFWHTREITIYIFRNGKWREEYAFGLVGKNYKPTVKALVDANRSNRFSVAHIIEYWDMKKEQRAVDVEQVGAYSAMRMSL